MGKEDKASAPSPGYGKGPPWIFEGRQVNLFEMGRVVCLPNVLITSWG